MSRDDAIAAETVRVVARRGATTISQTRHGLVMAAAGVDESNTAPGTVVLLPEDPDESARRLRKALRARLGVTVGVVVTDTFGRPWRAGQTDTAIGAAGVLPVRDHRGEARRVGQHPRGHHGGGRRRDRRRRRPGQGQGAAVAGRARARAVRPGHRRRRPGRAGACAGRERGHVPARRGRRAARPAHGPLVHRPAGRSRRGRARDRRRAHRPGAAPQRALAVRDRVIAGRPAGPARRDAATRGSRTCAATGSPRSRSPAAPGAACRCATRR